MRRRVKEWGGLKAPPLPLTRYRGRTNREALAWLRDRDDWWTANRDEDDSGWLAWLLEGHDQVGDFPWCGSVGAPCDDRDCLCIIWAEHLAQTDELNPQTIRRTSP